MSVQLNFKKTRSKDGGAQEKCQPVEFLQWVALDSAVIRQHILTYLTMHELVQLDTALSCNKIVYAEHLEAYAYGLGLQCNAVNFYKYDRVCDLRWISSRGICLQNFELQVPLKERAYARGMGLVQKDATKVFPTFHWLLYYHIKATSDEGKYRDVVRLIAACGRSRDLDMCDNNGWTALTLACDLGDAEVVRLLVGRGDLSLDIQGMSGTHPTTPLERAIRCNSCACVQALIAGGAVVTAESLHLAIKRVGRERLLDKPPPAHPEEEALLRQRQRGIYPHRMCILDKLQQTAGDLHNGGIDIVRGLAQAGYDVLNKVNASNRTAIEEARYQERLDVVAILQEAEEAHTAAADDAVAALMGLAFN